MGVRRQPLRVTVEQVLVLKLGLVLEQVLVLKLGLVWVRRPEQRGERVLCGYDR